MPRQTTPEQTTPEQTTPEQTTPEQATPEQATPEQADTKVICLTYSTGRFNSIDFAEIEQDGVYVGQAFVPADKLEWFKTRSDVFQIE